MARGAPRFVLKQLPATARTPTIDRPGERLRRSQRQLVVQQGRQLRRDQIGRLIDEEADSWIAEGAMAAHLADAHVAVPVRDRAVAGVGLKADTLEAIDRWH